MPPDIINSSSDKLHVLFSRYYDFSSIAVISNQIGFRMFYTVIEEPEQKFIDYMDNYSEGKTLIITSITVSDRRQTYKQTPIIQEIVCKQTNSLN